MLQENSSEWVVFGGYDQLSLVPCYRDPGHRRLLLEDMVCCNRSLAIETLVRMFNAVLRVHVAAQSILRALVAVQSILRVHVAVQTILRVHVAIQTILRVYVAVQSILRVHVAV